MNIQDAYAFFDLSPDCADNDIVKRYRQLAKAYHPDTHLNADDEEREKNEALFKNLTLAQDIILKDRAQSLKKSVSSTKTEPKEERANFYKREQSYRDPAEMASQFQNNLEKARVQRLQKTRDDDFRAMMRHLIFALASALIAKLSGFWIIYAASAYFGVVTVLILLDWRDLNDQLKEEQLS